MSRPPLLVLALALAALLALAPPATAPAAGPETGTIVTAELELQASNGLHAQLETSPNGEMVTLELQRKGRLVSYEVAGRVTEAGMRVRFGRLGLIDVAFTPTRTLSSTEPSEGCSGAPRTLREGTFAGKIDFTGERGYVRIAASQVEGSMSVISQWTCPKEPSLLEGARRSAAPGSRKGKQSASLEVFGRRCQCFFSAGIHYPGGRGRSIFYGLKAEHSEGMQIVRATVAHGGASAFVFDHAAGTATVRPPPPFSGVGTFRRRQGPDLWHSTIRIPLLGADPLTPDGPGFLAGLYPEYHFD
jgi:hypothetical protein